MQEKSKSDPLVFLHGQFIPQTQAALTLHDAGFVMGATVTDLCRTFHQKLYRWSDHLARFFASCYSTAIDLPMTAVEITARAEELAEYNGRLAGRELALVLFATPGPVGYYLGEPGGVGDGPVTFGMHTFPLPFERYRKLVGQGGVLAIPKVRQVPAVCVDPHIKMRSRMHWWLADREARRIDPAAMALLLDTDGCVTETAGANVLLLKNGTVFSPPRERILEGISLRVVRELCGRLGIPFAESRLGEGDLLAAEEILLTGTSFCLAGVRRCNGRAVNWPGLMLTRLAAAWNEEVELDIHGQIMS